MEIETILIQSQPRQKVTETTISANKLGVVVCACHPGYVGSIEVSQSRASPRQKHEPLSEK
jgi:hypothetical protein